MATVTQYADVSITSAYLGTDSLPIEIHAEVLRIWNELRGDAFAPSWGQFELTDFPLELIPYMSLTNISFPPLTSVYRFWGSRLTQIYGADFTGKSPSDVPPRRVGMDNQTGCAVVLRERKPHLNIREYKTLKGFWGRAMILRMPLSDDGRTVNHSFSVSHFSTTAPGDPLSTFYENVFSELERHVPQQAQWL